MKSITNNKSKYKANKLMKLTNAIISYENGMTQIGICIANFQMIEEVLSSSIAKMINRNKTIGMIVTSELSFRAKVSVFRALLIYRNNNEKLSEDLEDLIRRIYWAEQERNKLVHSIWDACRKKPETIIRKKISCRKKGLSIDWEHFTPEDLEELSGLYEGIATDIDYLTKVFKDEIKK